MGLEIHKVKSWNVLRANSANISTMSEMFGSMKFKRNFIW